MPKIILHPVSRGLVQVLRAKNDNDKKGELLAEIFEQDGGITIKSARFKTDAGSGPFTKSVRFEQTEVPKIFVEFEE
jgi:hypothetical protein